MDKNKIIKELRNIGGIIADKLGIEQARTYLKTIDDAISLMLKKQEVRIGHWVSPEDEGINIFSPEVFVQCSECGKKAQYGHKDKYCRNCGAKMEVGKQ